MEIIDTILDRNIIEVEYGHRFNHF